MTAETVNFFAYGMITIWAIFSVYYIFSKKKGKPVYNYVYDSIPSIFTTLGILGTFLGIFVGLQKFDVQNINDSIPILLDGMKTAFLTSILGIVLSIIFGKWSQIVAEITDRKENNIEIDEEIEALKQIIEVLQENQKKNDQNNNDLVYAINQHNVNQTQTVFSSFQNLEKVLYDIEKKSTQQLINIENILKEHNKETSKLVENCRAIQTMITQNQTFFSNKFDEFSQMLAKNNTEALVEVMKTATEEFNKQMAALINKLVQENFEELNRSVLQLNTWQQENKNMIGTLTQQFREVSNDLSISSNAIKEISTNTKKLTDDNSNLAKMIEELQKVMINDTKYQQIVNQLTNTINTLKENTITFDKTTNKLNEWVKNQMNFNEGVAVLIHKLNDVKNVKDINEIFWKNFEIQLNKGISTLEKATRGLSDELENINETYYQQLNDLLKNFDNALRRVIDNNRK